MGARRQNLTGTMSELEAEVTASESVDGDGKFDGLTPSRAVVVVEHQGAMLRHIGLAATHTDAVLSK